MACCAALMSLLNLPPSTSAQSKRLQSTVLISTLLLLLISAFKLSQMLQAVAHQAPRWLRPVLAASDAWPVRPLLALALSCASRDTAALVRTTVAVTGLDAFVADNVLPPAGRLNFNFRTLPGDDDDAVRRYLQSALDATGLRGDIRRSPRTTMGNPPSAITSTNSTYYALLKRAIQELWRQQDNGSGGSNSASSQQQQQPSSLADGGRSLRSGGSREGRPVDVAPLLLGGGTDSKHYAALSRHGVLRFNPYAVTKASAKLLHASNERLSLDNFRRGICTYQRIFELFGGGSATAMAA